VGQNKNKEILCTASKIIATLMYADVIIDPDGDYAATKPQHLAKIGKAICPLGISVADLPDELQKHIATLCKAPKAKNEGQGKETEGRSKKDKDKKAIKKDGKASKKDKKQAKGSKK
jgi:hypothetical protein